MGVDVVAVVVVVAAAAAAVRILQRPAVPVHSSRSTSACTAVVVRPASSPNAREAEVQVG